MWIHASSKTKTVLTINDVSVLVVFLLRWLNQVDDDDVYNDDNNDNAEDDDDDNNEDDGNNDGGHAYHWFFTQIAPVFFGELENGIFRQSG
ncbi:hypothetical protein PoB_004359000, partial [Plakobranchus ocellatus]